MVIQRITLNDISFWDNSDRNKRITLFFGDTIEHPELFLPRVDCYVKLHNKDYKVMDIEHVYHDDKTYDVNVYVEEK